MSSQIDSSHRQRQSRALRNRGKPRKKVLARPSVHGAGLSAGKAASPGTASPAQAHTGAESGPKSKLRWLIWPLVILQLALLAVVVMLIRAPKPDLPELPDREVREVRFQIRGGEDIVESVYYGEEVSLPASVDVGGFTFLGWEEPDGRIESHSSVPVYRNMVYTARLIPAFETEKHIPYLHTDEEAVLDGAPLKDAAVFASAD